MTDQDRKNVFAMENTDMTVDQVDKSIIFMGNSSSYQKRTIILLSIIQCCFSFLVMGFPFLFKDPIFLCHNQQGTYQCRENESCQQGVEISEVNIINSLTYDFELWCDRKYLIVLSGSLLFFGKSTIFKHYNQKGQTLSGFVFPQLSALKGRQYCIILSCGMAALPLMLAAALDSMLLFLFALLLAGIGQSGFENEAFVYLSEISGDKFRNFSQVILLAVWGGAQILFALLLQYQQNWRVIVTLFIGGPMIIGMILIFQYVYESPRFLVAQRLFDQARKVLTKIAIINGRPNFQYRFDNETRADKQDRQMQKTFKKFLTRQLLIKSNEVGQHDNLNRLQAQASSYSYLDLFRYESLRMLTIMLILLWTFRYQTYFGLAYTMLSFGDDMNENFFFIAISEVMAYLLSVSIQLKFKRVPTMAIFGILSSASSIIIFFPNIPLNCFHLQETCYQKELLFLLAIIVKFSITIFGDILVVYTTEVYPTVVRSQGLGLCISVGKIGFLQIIIKFSGTIFVPLIVNIFQFYGINPLIVFGSIGFFAVYGLRYIPETHKKKMSDYIYETYEQDRPLVELQGNI